MCVCVCHDCINAHAGAPRRLDAVPRPQQTIAASGFPEAPHDDALRGEETLHSASSFCVVSLVGCSRNGSSTVGSSSSSSSSNSSRW